MPGDGIGPEIMSEALKVLRALSNDFEFEFADVKKDFIFVDDGSSDNTISIINVCSINFFALIFPLNTDVSTFLRYNVSARKIGGKPQKACT